MTDTYWEYELSMDLESDGEYESQERAQAAADEAWAEHIHEVCVPRNGEVWEDTFVLREYEFGDSTPIQEIEGEVYYEHYHGDREEHFRQGDYI